MKKDKSTKYI